MSEEEILAESDPDFAKLVGAAGKELTRRLDKDPDSIPGTFLIKLWLDGNKALRAGDAPTDDAPPDPDVLELIQQEGLPRERKLELLIQEEARVRGRLIALEAAMEELGD